MSVFLLAGKHMPTPLSVADIGLHAPAETKRANQTAIPALSVVDPLFDFIFSIVVIIKKQQQQWCVGLRLRVALALPFGGGGVVSGGNEEKEEWKE